MFNFFKKKVVTENQDDFTINNLKNIAVQAHKEYVYKTTNRLINDVKSCIRITARNGLYQFSTMTSYEDDFKEFSRSVTSDEWAIFMNTLRNTFNEIQISSSINNKYWIDFDWSGRDE